MLQMRCSHSYTLNKNVFSLRLNLSAQRLMMTCIKCVLTRRSAHYD